MGPLHFSWKKAAVMRVYTASLAPQLMRGITMMVVSLLRLFSRILVAIIAGTEQPKPMSIGMKLFPWRPILCMILSITKAALDM